MIRALAVFGLCAAAVAHAQPIYSWTDPDGQTHYTDDLSAVPKKVRDERNWHGPPAADPGVPPEAAVDAPVAAGLSEKSKEILAAMKRGAWNADDRHAYDSAYGPAFLELAEVSAEPNVITAALRALASLYSPNPGAGATFNGVPYTRLQYDDRVHLTALKRLNHPDPHVRSAAAILFGWSAWGEQPREGALEALLARLKVEPDDAVADLVEDAIWNCHCGRPELVEAALLRLAEGRSARSQTLALGDLAMVGHNGRNFDPASLSRLHAATERFLEHPSLELRRNALPAWRATYSGPVGAAIDRLSAAATSGEPLMRYTAVELLGRETDARAIEPLLKVLEDRTSREPLNDPRARHLHTLAERALHSLSRLSASVDPGRPFVFAGGPDALTPKALEGEIDRAKSWAATRAAPAEAPPAPRAPAFDPAPVPAPRARIAWEQVAMASLLFLLGGWAFYAALWGKHQTRRRRPGEGMSLEHLLAAVSPALARLFSKAITLVGALALIGGGLYVLIHRW